MQYKVKLSPKFLTMALAFVMIAAGSSIAAPAPIAMSGNPSCATLNASANPAFAHMTTDWEFKLDPPSAGTHPLTSVSGGMNTGETERVVTNSFGVYIFSGLPVNNFYTLNVQAVRQTFFDPARTFELADNLTDYDFVAVR